MGEGQCETSVKEVPKKPRHRKKHLYNTILQQMEFYFSDSNLAKDRFLSQLLSEQSYVDIEVFLKFNKIKKLNCTVEDIQKAIRKSELIGLTEDGQKIHRKKPVKIKQNVDFCTIYVENINSDANHESLSQIFSDFGKVVYVSVPKYKHNKVNKGFAFIEYETEEQANDAVAFFESIGCRIPTEKNPEELQSIVTYEGDQADEKTGTSCDTKEEYSKVEVDKVDHKTDIEDVNVSEQSLKKRKLSEGIEEKKGLSKKQKTDTEGCESQAVEETEEVKKKKKSKKDKRKNYIKELGMQVLPKKEWKKLRNCYLDLQKKKMKEFKQYLYKQKFGPKNYQKDDYESEEKEEKKESEEITNEINKLQYTPGVIVKLKLSEPCMDVKKFKNEVKSVSSEVKFVDIPLTAGSDEVFVRFGTKEAASDFCDKEFNGEKVVISGDEEKSYWDKLLQDRKEKFKKQAKKQRGREKLLKRAEKESAKHIKFDENE